MTTMPRNVFSQEYRDFIARLRSDVDAMAAALAGDSMHTGSTYGRIPFRLTAVSATTSSYPIWTYSGTQQTPTAATGTDADWENMTNGITATDTMVNDLEAGNSPTSAYGYAVTYSGGVWKFSTAPFTETEFRPVTLNIVVWAKPVVRSDNVLRWHFSAPNYIGPGCEA